MSSAIPTNQELQTSSREGFPEFTENNLGANEDQRIQKLNQEVKQRKTILLILVLVLMALVLFTFMFENKSESKLEKLENNPEKNPENQAETKYITKPETKPETKPLTKPETKPQEKAETKPLTKPETKPQEKPETKPETPAKNKWDQIPTLPPSSDGRNTYFNKSTTNEYAFNLIYGKKIWEKSGFPSGGGSDPQKNKQWLKFVQKLIDHPSIKNIVEIGFGDYGLARLYNIPEGKKYIGYEVVQSLMQKNTTYREFRLIKSIHEINETGDLMINKDIIIHWPNREVKYYLDTLVPRFKYTLLQVDGTDGPQKDINFGEWRPLNLNDYEPKEQMQLNEITPYPKKTYMLPHYPKTP